MTDLRETAVRSAVADVVPLQSQPREDLTTALVPMSEVEAHMPVYLAGALVREHGLHLWWSQPGNLKTYLAIRLVLEMTQRAAGEPLFNVEGMEIVRPWRKVVWLGDEESPEEWKARAEAVARGHGLKPPGAEILFADATGGATMLNLDHVPQLIEAAGHETDAVFCDPLANLSPDTDRDGRPVKVDLDNPHALKRICRPLRRLCKRRGLAVFLLHHANSTGGRERGPTAYRGSADVVAELKYEGDVLTLADNKNRDRAKGRISFRPVWERDGELWTVRFEHAEEPEDSVLRSLKGTARAMYSAIEVGAGKITVRDLKAARYPGPGGQDVAARTKRRAWESIVKAGLAVDDSGIVRLIDPKDCADTTGHEADTRDQ